MTVVAIPAHRPDRRFVDLTAALHDRDPSLDIVVVDDGSGAEFAPLFAAVAESGVTVLRHDVNRGKGAALHSLFRYARSAFPGAAVVTADADGQHTPDDIVRIARETELSSGDIVLGVRDFAADDVPLRSRFGNAVSVHLFAAAIGERIGDTQTGLRGLPARALPWASALPGERFEYEAIMLLRARRAGFSLRQHPIATVYLDDNRSSHFRPVRDSLRVLWPVLSFLASSLLAAIVDAVVLWLLFTASGWLIGSIVGARIVSASLNFAVNRRWVFRRGRTADAGPAPIRRELVRYALLAAAILVANAALLSLLTSLGVGLVAAKLTTEAMLWLVAFAAQRIWVFARTARPTKPFVVA